MNLTTLSKSITRGKRRIGQGHGSGRVKTAGRGTKGQQARRSIPLFFEGGALPLIKRLPFMRGKGRNFSFQSKPEVVNVEQLNTLPKNSTIDLKMLVSRNLVREDRAVKYGIKILGTGALSVPVTVKVPVSKSAKAKIEKAGGKVEILDIQ